MYLKKAKPAKTSYIDNFDLTEDPLRYLPPSIGITLSGDEARSVEEAIRKGQTWQEYDPTASVTIKDKNNIEIKYEGGGFTFITLQAWGDFNQDGIEDILLFLLQDTGGSLTYSEHAILTRLEENEPLVQLFMKD